MRNANSLKKVAGGKLEMRLGQLTSSPARGVLLGTFVKQEWERKEKQLRHTAQNFPEQIKQKHDLASIQSPHVDFLYLFSCE